MHEETTTMKNGKEKTTKVVDQELSATATSLAGILAEYNEGLIGPGHCGDEEVTLS